MPELQKTLPNKLAFDRHVALNIGIEGAILLQYLSQYGTAIQAKNPPNSATKEIAVSTLLTVFEFWDEQDLRTRLEHLEAQKIIKINTYASNIRYTLFMLLEPINMQVATNVGNTEKPQQRAQGLNSTVIDPNWQISVRVLELLKCQHGIDAAEAQNFRNEFVIYWSNRKEAKHSWDTVFIQQAVHAHRQVQHLANRPALNESWQPSEFCVGTLNADGINSSFINKTRVGFINYWLEQDPMAGHWDNRFTKHCKHQWTYAQANANMPVAQLLSTDWRPSEIVYEGLEQIGIERNYVKSQLAEFILYCQGRQMRHDNWNLYFMRRIKERWENDHKQTINGSDWQRFIDRHTDSSWHNDLS